MLLCSIRAVVAMAVLFGALAHLDAAEHTGTVTFTGLPVPGVALTVTRGDVRKTTVSGPDGTYRFDDLADGEWTLRIEMIGFATRTEAITVGPSRPPSVWALSMQSFDAIMAAVPLEPEAAPSTHAGTPTDAVANAAVSARSASVGTPLADAAFAEAESLLINGSVNNGAASPFAQMAAFGNSRRGQRRLYNGGLGIVFGTSAWDSSPFSFTNQPTAKPEYNDMQWLATFGGPLRLSPLTRNGPTIFAGYQGSVDHTVTTQSARMPTALERVGDFSQSRDALGRPISIIDPRTGQPFPGNAIPRDRLSVQALSLLQYYPEANATGDGYNFQATTLTVTHQHNVQFRASQTLGHGNSLFGNVLHARTQIDSTDLFGLTDKNVASSTDIALNWVHRFSSLSTLRLRYLKEGQNSQTTPFFSGRTNVSGAAGIAGNNQEPANWGPPRLSFASGLAGLSSGASADNHASTDTASTEGIRVVGRHNLTFGGGWGRRRFSVVAQQDARGTFGFTGASTGWDVADFLLGLPATSSIAFGNADKRLTGTTANAYLNDNWRVSPSLTVNAGARWEFESPLAEQLDRLANLLAASNFATIATVVPGSDIARQNNLPDALLHPDWHGIQPRVGVAWRPMADSALVVRSGYGIYRNTDNYRSLALLLAQQPPFSKAFNVASTAETPLTLANGFISSAEAGSNTFGIDPDFRVGYAHIWQASAQQNLPDSLTLIVTYLGTRGSHLMQEFLPNTYPAGATNPCPSCPSGFVYVTSNASSLRNAAQVQLRRRLRNGFSATVDYTLAKATDNASGFVPLGNQLQTGVSATSTNGASTGVAGATVAQDWLDLDAERARSPFDQRHRLSVQVQYTTGMGVTGGALLDSLRARLLLGWTFTSQFTVGSGLPLTPMSLVPVSGTGIIGTIRASLTGVNTDAPSGYYLNPAAYAPPASGNGGPPGATQ